MNPFLKFHPRLLTSGAGSPMTNVEGKPPDD